MPRCMTRLVQEPCPGTAPSGAPGRDAVPAVPRPPVFRVDTATPAHDAGISRGRRALLQAAVLGWALPAAAQPAPAIVPVAPGLWRVPVADGAEPEPGNGGHTVQLVAAVERGRTWLVGSGPSPAFGERLRAALQAAGLPPVAAVVHTRAHPALALGDGALPGAQGWALRAVAARMAAQCADCVARLKAEVGDDTLSPAAIRVPRAFVDADGAREGRLGPFDWWTLRRAADAPPLLLLRHRASGIVVAQGLLWAGAVPSLAEAHAGLLDAAWQALARGLGPQGRVLGEQGAPAGAAALQAHRRYLAALRAAVDARLGQGDSEAGAAAAIVLPAFAALPGYARRHPLNVQRLWREREAQLLAPR